MGNAFISRKSGGTAIKGIIEQYKVDKGASVSAGDFVEFTTRYRSGTSSSATGSEGLCACALSDTQVLLLNASACVITLLNIDGAEIVAVASQGLGAISSYPSLVRLSTTRALLIANYSIAAYVITVSDSTFTIGAANSIAKGGSDVQHFACTALSSSKALLVDYYNTFYYFRVLSISGDTVTAGATASIRDGYNGGGTHYARLTALSSNKAYFNFSILYDSGYPQYLVTVNGTTCTLAALEASGSTIAQGLDANTLIEFCPGTDVITAKLRRVDTGDTLHEYSFSANWPKGVGVGSVCKLSANKVALLYPTGTFTVPTSSNSSCTHLYYALAVFAIENGQIVLKVSKQRVCESAYKGSYEKSYAAIAAYKEDRIILLGDKYAGPGSTFYTYAANYYDYCIDNDNIYKEDAIIYVSLAASRNGYVGVAKTSGNEYDTVDVYCVDTN